MEGRGNFLELISWFLGSGTRGRKGLWGKMKDKGTVVTSTEGTSGPCAGSPLGAGWLVPLVQNRAWAVAAG